MTATPRPLDDLDDVAVVFDALAHAARRQILLVLLARGETMTSREIADRFATTWATISRHLKTLEAAGLVRVIDGDDGRVRSYELDRPRILEVAGGWVTHFAPAATTPREGGQP